MSHSDIKKVGIALQGGGAHGAFTWGVLDKLLEADHIVADAMCGTSAGAINAVTCAYGLHVGGPKKAKELLQQTEETISSIAFDCGFQDPGYFARVFKQEFGRTPQEWRGEVKSV